MSERFNRTEYHLTRVQWTPPKETEEFKQLPNVCVEADKRHEDDEWCHAYVHIERDTTDGKRHWTPAEAVAIARALFQAAREGLAMDKEHELTQQDEATETPRGNA